MARAGGFVFEEFSHCYPTQLDFILPAKYEQWRSVNLLSREIREYQEWLFCNGRFAAFVRLTQIKKNERRCSCMVVRVRRRY